MSKLLTGKLPTDHKITSRHTNERYFFDIPVFRCDIDTWANKQEDKKKQLAQRMAVNKKDITEREVDFVEKWLRPEWSSYYYSEMIGMIRLFAIPIDITL